MLIKTVTGTLAVACLIYAGGGKPTGSPPPTIPAAPELAISHEVVPPGGTTQIRIGFTSPQPIMSGGGRLAAFDVNGVALWSPLGDAAGIAVKQNDNLVISGISPKADLGTVPDYPFLTVTMTVPSTLKPGTVFPMNLDSAGFVNTDGAIPLTMKPGAITIGGSFSIQGVYPGGGNWRAGTMLRVQGTGFQSNAKVQTRNFNISSFKVVSSSEIDLFLKEAATLDGAQVSVNSGGFIQTYNLYLRSTQLKEPSRPLLRKADPIFQQLTHALAQVGPLPASDDAHYTGLAVQNPNEGPAVVTLTVTHADGSVTTTAILLPSCSKVMDDIASLAGLSSIQAGDVLNLQSTSAVQILGIRGDELAGTLTPFLPEF